MLLPGKYVNSLVKHANDRLEVVSEWCNSNMFHLKLKKLELMVVTNRGELPEVQLKMGVDQIKQVDSVKYPRVIMDW